MNAHIVIGLGFGDEGKGAKVDRLCKKAERPIVVRFSGGQQAGHTVMIDDKKHVHSNYGAGTLRGVPSFFSEHTTFYLNTMFTEKDVLKIKGVEPKLYMHPLAMVTTPFDVAWNRATEQENKHGSCGLGVAATNKRNVETPHKFYAIHLMNKNIRVNKMIAIGKYYEEMAEKKGIKFWQEFKRISDNEMKEFTYHMITPENFYEIADYSHLHHYTDVIFEGSQGILLDMSHGVFPNVTYGNTTSKNAMEICKTLATYPLVHYVTRCYQTRHGAGWMSSTKDIELINTEEEINMYNEWQRDFRYRELDYDLLKYALEVDNIYVPGKHKNLVVTCLDQRPGFEFDVSKFGYPIMSVEKIASPKTI